VELEVLGPFEQIRRDDQARPALSCERIDARRRLRELEAELAIERSGRRVEQTCARFTRNDELHVRTLTRKRYLAE
jgi:hypothetical protein